MRSHPPLTCLRVALLVGSYALAQAQSHQRPDAFIRDLSLEVLAAVKADKPVRAGSHPNLVAFLDAKVMLCVDLQRMAVLVVGRHWRRATPEQQNRLRDEFRRMLVRTYSEHLAEVKNQTVEVKPMRDAPGDLEVFVKTVITGGDEVVHLDYRLEQTASGWKIYDINVLGNWLVETYRNKFARDIEERGLDGVIEALAKQNQEATAKR